MPSASMLSAITKPGMTCPAVLEEPEPEPESGAGAGAGAKAAFAAASYNSI